MKVFLSSEYKNTELNARVFKVLDKIGEVLNLKDFYVEVNLVDDSFMKKNVLSYPADPNFPRPDVIEKNLGEIYLNPNYIKEYNEDFDLMLVHGFLHLLGYDHKEGADALKMEAKEQELLQVTKSL